MTVISGHITTHSHPLDENAKAPAPYVRFDSVGGDGGFTAREYHLAFHTVGRRIRREDEQRYAQE
jgi:hypothetical protein